MQNKKEAIGGEIETIEIEAPVVDVVKTEQDSIIKEPIFIGQVDLEILNQLEGLIDKDRFELAVLSQSLQKNCREAYFFSKLGDKERDNMMAAKRDSIQREQALQSIYEVEKMFASHLKKQSIEYNKEAGELIIFKPYEMQNLVSAVRGKKLSVSDIREAIENFQIHGFVTPTINGEAYHKQQFAITIDPASRLQVLSAIKENMEMEIKLLEQRKELYNNEIIAISRELSADIDLEEPKKIDKFKPLTEKQTVVLNIFKNAPNKLFTVGQVSKIYNDKSSSCTETIQKLFEFNYLLEKKNEKDKAVYAINPEVFKD